MCHGADDDAGLWRRGALAERRELDGLHDCISKPAAVEFLNRVVPPEARESSGGFVGGAEATTRRATWLVSTTGALDCRRRRHPSELRTSGSRRGRWSSRGPTSRDVAGLDDVPKPTASIRASNFRACALDAIVPSASNIRKASRALAEPRPTSRAGQRGFRRRATSSGLRERADTARATTRPRRGGVGTFFFYSQNLFFQG